MFCRIIAVNGTTLMDFMYSLINGNTQLSILLIANSIEPRANARIFFNIKKINQMSHLFRKSYKPKKKLIDKNQKGQMAMKIDLNGNQLC